MQMDGGIEVSLHKIYVNVSILNKTFANMRQVPKCRVLHITGAEVFGVVCLGT